MRTALTILVAISLCGCASMTEREKKWTGVIVGAVVVGALAAHRSGGSAPQSGAAVGQPPSCFPQPDGSCR
jgi:hypothetical protein